MPTAAAIVRQDQQWVLSGEWTLANYAALQQLLRTHASPAPGTTLAFGAISRLDTAGATLLVNWLGTDALAQQLAQDASLPPERRALFDSLIRALETGFDARPVRPRPRLIDRVEQLGARSQQGVEQFLLLSGLVGQVQLLLLANLLRPWRWRVTALVSQIHRAGLDALPIVALLTFLVGAVVAFLGATVLSEFGAEIYTVNLVAYSFLREFGVLLAAILLAGRTASAFTAQIGAMKANQELDALRTLGLDPVELLVLPRVLALVLVLPLLTFVAMMAGLFGGALVTRFALDIPIAQYLSILADVPLQHYLVGLSKAPVFAFLIAVIGCLEGFKVHGSAESVGQHTTASVVQAIFTVILLDAVAAMFFMEMGW